MKIIALRTGFNAYSLYRVGDGPRVYLMTVEASCAEQALTLYNLYVLFRGEAV